MDDLDRVIESRVPAPLLDQATPIEKHLLIQSDNTQQRLYDVAAAIKTIRVDFVEDKTELAKLGVRVETLESNVADLNKFHTTALRYRQALLWICGLLAPILYVIFEKLADRLFGK